MDISTKLRYGARALAELGLAYPDHVVSVRELADLQSLSIKYLEHILSALKNAGIVRAERGMRGGYVLNDDPGNITLHSAYIALEGPTAPVRCVEVPESCEMTEECPTHQTWVEMDNAIVRVLESTTIADLAGRIQRERDKADSES